MGVVPYLGLKYLEFLESLNLRVITKLCLDLIKLLLKLKKKLSYF